MDGGWGGVWPWPRVWFEVSIGSVTATASATAPITVTPSRPAPAGGLRIRDLRVDPAEPQTAERVAVRFTLDNDGEDRLQPYFAYTGLLTVLSVDGQVVQEHPFGKDDASDSEPEVRLTRQRAPRIIQASSRL